MSLIDLHSSGRPDMQIASIERANKRNQKPHDQNVLSSVACSLVVIYGVSLLEIIWLHIR
jgi:hypothetical protein